MKKLTGRDGELRVSDSSNIIARGSQSNMNTEIYDSSGPTFTDKTAEAFSANAAYTGVFWADTNDLIVVGCTAKFARIRFTKGAGGAYATGAGALIVKYYNGTSWVVLSVTDNTVVTANTLKQDGTIHFQIPRDWAKAGMSGLDADKYYLQLLPTTVPSVPPSADVLAPEDGQFLIIPFAGMDFNGPVGRARSTELLQLNRNKMDAYAHYIEGNDAIIYDPFEVSFSCAIDDTHNRSAVVDALTCATPGSTYWAAAGVSSKGDTKNDGTNYNPGFADTTKKAVNIEMLWTQTYSYGQAFYEIYIPQQNAKITESEEGVILSVTGLVYGVIERIYGFGVRY